MREAARAVGASASAYRHSANRPDALTASAEVGFSRMQRRALKASGGYFLGRGQEPAGGAIEARVGRRWASPWRLALVPLGLGLLLFLVFRLGASRIAEALISVGPGFALVLAIYGAGLSLSAFGLPALLDPADRPSLAASLASRFAATSLNDLLPVLGVGGEASRALWFSPKRRFAVVHALILDRILLIVSDALFVAAVALAALVGLTVPARLMWHAAATFAAMLGLGAALIWFTLRHGVAVPAAKLLALGKMRGAGKWLEQARGIDASVREVWQQHPRRAMHNLLIQLGSRLLLCLETWVGLALLHVELDVLSALIIAAVPMAVSVAFFFVPSQLGAQEASLALAFALLHLDPALGLALSMLQRMRQLVFAPLGVFLLTTAPRRH